MVEGKNGFFLVTYTGHDVVTLGSAGVFQNGTRAFVCQADADLARGRDHFTVTDPAGRAVKTAREPEPHGEPAPQAEPEPEDAHEHAHAPKRAPAKAHAKKGNGHGNGHGKHH